MTTSLTPPIRALWHRIETIHAVTYFAEECRSASSDLGLLGFWMGYFGCRAAPMGAVPASMVEATFANFAPGMVSRAIPDAWVLAEPNTIVEKRREAAADALRWASTEIVEAAEKANPLLLQAISSADPMGRPLFGANAALSLAPIQPEDPVEALWQHCTTLREHRGDGHLHALGALGLRGIEAHVLAVASGGASPSAEKLMESRGWTVEEWDDAIDALVDRELISVGVDGAAADVPTDNPSVALTEAGRAVKEGVERTTDSLARRPFDDSGTSIATLIEALETSAIQISAASIITYPNPIGLPALD